MRGIHVPGVLWYGYQESGFVGVKASFDEVGGGSANPEFFEGFAGVFGTQMQLLAVPDVANPQNHQRAHADPDACLSLGGGRAVGIEQRLRVGAKAEIGDFGEVDLHRRMGSAGVSVRVGNLAKPIDTPESIVFGKCSNVKRLLWSPWCSGMPAADRGIAQICPDKY